MGLTTPQKIKVNITNKNAKYYANLGYEVPKRNNKRGTMSYDTTKSILVDIDDLPLQANYDVDCT